MARSTAAQSSAGCVARGLPHEALSFRGDATEPGKREVEREHARALGGEPGEELLADPIGGGMIGIDPPM